MSELLKSIREHLKQRPDQAKLSQTSLVKDLEPSEMKIVIEGLYADKELNNKLFASVLNSIFTQHRGVFLFSRHIMEELIKNDKNLKRKTINGSEYANFMINTCGRFIEQITEASEEKKATVYKLSDKAILEHLLTLISKKILKEQEEQCLTIFNSYDETSKKTSKKTSTGLDRTDLARPASKKSVVKKDSFKEEKEDSFDRLMSEAMAEYR